MTCNGAPTVPPVLEFFNGFLKFMFILKVPLYNIPGCYPEILGKWRFRGTGKNLRGLVFATQLESKGGLEPPDRVQSWSPGHFSHHKVLKGWKYNFSLFYTIPVLQNKHIVVPKQTRRDYLMVESFVNFKNGLT